MSEVQQLVVLTILAFFAHIPISHSQYGQTSEIAHLTERLFHAMEPSIMSYVNVNLQHHTSSWSDGDDAPGPLLKVNEAIFHKIPTIAKLLPLFNEYKIDSAVDEITTPTKEKEINEFINALLDTEVMKIAMEFLQTKGIVTSARKSHYDLLRKDWFDMYSRDHGYHVGSSGFEHSFLTEIKYGSPIGLHNWIYYYMLENNHTSSHHVDYKGFMDILHLGKADVIKYRLSLDNHNKPVNSMFIGTLPEFEIALYTICFEAGDNNCQISLGGNPLTIRTFPFYYGGKRMVASAYPVI